MRKTKFRFNIMDALILLVLAAAVLVLLYVFVWSEHTSLGSLKGEEPHKIHYVVEITGLSEQYRDLIEVGDSVIDSSKKMNIGTVTAVEWQDYMYLGTNLHEGSLTLNPVEDYVTMYVTIEADASMDGISYSISGYEIYVGAFVYMSFSDLVCSGYCISLSEQS